MSKKIIPALILTSLFVSCAKEREYKKVHVDNPNLQYSKADLESLCNSKEPLLFVPSVGAVPRAVSAARPYELGEAKVVSCEIKQEKVVFNEIEDDTRFAVNTNNKSPVFEISLEHLDYKCEEDSYGDCTNKEEEDEEKPWQQRRIVQVDDQSVNILAQDINLSLDRSNLLNGCFTEVSKEINGFSFDKRSMNFTIKKQMSASLECASFVQTAEDIRYTKFYTDYNYSLIKLSDIADPNYEKVNYPKFDQTKFGFFKTEKINMTTDNLTSVIGTKSYLLNRWSPNKKKITYYLSKHFYDKGMESVLKATIDGIMTVNKSLAAAGTKLEIELKDGRKVNEGDIKNNFLVLVKDPHSSGVIGYGPSIKNPNTGEILSARTIMYYGTIRKTIARAYDRMLEQGPVIPTKVEKLATVNSGSVTKDSELAIFAQEVSSEVERDAMLAYQRFNNTLRDLDPLSYFRKEGIADVDFDQSVNEVKTNLEEFKKELEELSEKTFYHESMMNVTSLIDTMDIKVRKPWAQLTEIEKSQVIDVMLPYVWVPTLVHEFGHNLGLRHNFYGSVDKDNFYTNDEAVALKLKRTPEYSSIMDYAYNEHTELSIMGKYDVAALRFAYTREVDHGTGKVIKVDDSLEEENKEYVVENIDFINNQAKEFAEEYKLDGVDYKSIKDELENLYSNANDENTISKVEMLQKKFNQFATMELKPYQYCTDEDTGNDILCNRHDEGVGLEGLADHLISKYAEYYKYRNLRGRSFDYNSVRGDLGYAQYVLGSFSSMRQVLNTYSAYEGAGWGKSNVKVNQEKYKDAKAAADKVFNFFISTVKKAPKSCAIFENNDNDLAKSKLVGVLPLGSTFASATACEQYQEYFRGPRSSFPVGTKEKIIAVDAGHFINNAVNYSKDFETSSLISQIDIRGIGLDKVFAMDMLTQRDASIFTGFTSFLDFPRYKEQVVTLLGEIVANKLNTTISFVAPNGTVKTQEQVYNLVETHSLKMSYNQTINGYLGLLSEQNDIRKPMLRLVKRNFRNYKGEIRSDLDTLSDDFKVFWGGRKTDISRENYDEVVSFKNSAGKVTARYGIYDYNTVGMGLVKVKRTLDKLEVLNENQKETLMTVLRGTTNPQDIKDEALIAILSDQEAIAPLIDYLQGFLTVDTLKKTFKALSQ